SKHVPASCSAGVSPAISMPYGCPAAFTATFGFFLLLASIWFDFSSIHWSSFDFLKRQRLPSLKAGIFCSLTYLYSVSGLTPRYCEAWRMFITSRASAIVSAPSTEQTRSQPIYSRLRPRDLENSRSNFGQKLSLRVLTCRE